MSKQRRKSSDCPNCGNHLRHDDEFCSRCGQENHELRVPIGHLLFEFIESITHFDGKLWATLRAMLVPGKVTEDYLAGKRARFVPPGRLYIFTSIVYFFLLGWSLKHSGIETLRNGEGTATVSAREERTVDEPLPEGSMRIKNGEVQMNSSIPDSLIKSLRARAGELTREDLDSALVSIGWEPTWLRGRLLKAIVHLPDDKEAAVAYVTMLVPKAMSYSMFLLMPFLALLLELIVARRRYYYEHIIFSVHIHIASFMLSIAQTVIAMAGNELWSSITTGIFTLVMVVYFILALKRVYGKTIGAAIGYSLVLALPYYLATGLLMVLFFAVGFLWV